MKKIIIFAILSISIVFASNIKIENAYARATPPNLPNSAAFMNVTNTSGEDISILKASSDVSKVVELHTHSMKNGIMKMYKVEKIDIKANSTTTLKPGGFHIMLIGLKKPLKVGEDVTLTLEFSNGETKTIIANVKTVMAGMNHHGNHNMHH